MMIERLTAEQEALLPEYYARWEAVALSTEPANRTQAELGIRLIYEAAKLQPPAQIIWTESPEASAEAYRQTFTRTVRGHKLLNTETDAPIREQIHRLWHVTNKNVRSCIPSSNDSGSAYQVSWQLHSLLNKRVWYRVGQRVYGRFRKNGWLWDRLGSVPNSGIAGGGRVLTYVHGQHDASIMAHYAFLREVCGLTEETKPWLGQISLAQSANWWLPCQDICWISDRPCHIYFDKNNRLHCEDGPAIEYRDGWGSFCWHGVSVPVEIIMHPESITVERINNEKNIEVRRVMLERYGEARYIEDSNVEVIHEDEHGTLYRHSFSSDEPLVMVRVTNSTPEPDGSHKHYWLRVPPTMQTAHQAVAWTFEMTPEQYQPMFES